MDAHVSQFYEWLPWIDGLTEAVPHEPEARRNWLSATRSASISSSVRQALARRYPNEHSETVHAEAFEICEYGRQPSPEDLDAIFPR
jgi:hypothetical protein